jgi:hypothetical protein
MSKHAIDPAAPGTPEAAAATADAKQRSIRTLAQGLAVDALVAAGATTVLVVAGLTDDQLLTSAAWVTLGTAVAKSVLTAVASYVARLKVPPASE